MQRNKSGALPDQEGKGQNNEVWCLENSNGTEPNISN